MSAFDTRTSVWHSTSSCSTVTCFSKIIEFNWSLRRSAICFLRTRVASAEAAFMLEFTLKIRVEVPKILLTRSLLTPTDASLVYWMCLSIL